MQKTGSFKVLLCCAAVTEREREREDSEESLVRPASVKKTVSDILQVNPMSIYLAERPDLLPYITSTMFIYKIVNAISAAKVTLTT